jgi:hypothetical protein
MRQKLLGVGVYPADKGPDELRARVVRELSMWKDFLAKTGIKSDR